MINAENTGLAAERLAQIREILRTRRIARVGDLCTELGVSPATVRRDLETLEGRGHLRRVHGGAVSVESRLDEPLFDDKAGVAETEKQSIAREAMKYVGARDSIFLDGGSTVLRLAILLKEMPHVTVVTNSLRVAGTLAGEGPRVIVTGGELRRLSQTFVGTLCAPLVEQLHVDTAFMGTIGVSVQDGLTTTDPREAATKSLVMAHANKVVLMADNSKLETLSFVRFGSLDDVDVLITNGGAAAQTLKAIKRKGVTVVLTQ